MLNYDFNAWIIASEQANEIAASIMLFKTKKEYEDYIIDLTQEIYEQMMKDCE